MSRKKILWLCSWYPSKLEPFNGDFIQRQARTAALYNDIYVIHVTSDITGKIKQTEKIINKLPGLTEHIVYYRKSNSPFGKLISYFRWLSLFRQAIRRSMIEQGKPALVHVHIPYKAGIFGIWIKNRYKIPYVVTEHWGIYNDIEKENYSGRSATFKKLTKKIITKAARFISVSSYLGNGVNKLVVKKDFQVITNTVDTDLFYYQEKKSPVFRFIHVSNMVPLKNAEGILEAYNLFCRNHFNTELVMVGDSDPAIRSFAAQLEFHGGSVKFCGEVPYKQVALEMQHSNCLILFSNIENSPCVIGEALCCGLPVIVTNVGGIPELVNKSNSLVVEPKEIEALTNAMSEMVSNYSVYDHKKIAEDAKSKFSYSVIGKEFDEVYDSIISAIN